MKKWLGFYVHIYIKKMKAYSSLLDAIYKLRMEGYVEYFKLRQESIQYNKGNLKIFHNEFDIDQYYLLDENSEPENQSIIYAISSEKYHLKGILVNDFALYSESLSDQMLEKLWV